MQGSHGEPIEMLMNRARLGSHITQHSPPRCLHLENLKDRGSGCRSQPQNPTKVAAAAPGHRDLTEDVPERVRGRHRATSSAGNTLQEPAPLCRHLQERFDASTAGQPFPNITPQCRCSQRRRLRPWVGSFFPLPWLTLHPVGREQHPVGPVHLLCDV